MTVNSDEAPILLLTLPADPAPPSWPRMPEVTLSWHSVSTFQSRGWSQECGCGQIPGCSHRYPVKSKDTHTAQLMVPWRNFHHCHQISRERVFLALTSSPPPLSFFFFFKLPSPVVERALLSLRSLEIHLEEKFRKPHKRIIFTAFFRIKEGTWDGQPCLWAAVSDVQTG